MSGDFGVLMKQVRPSCLWPQVSSAFPEQSVGWAPGERNLCPGSPFLLSFSNTVCTSSILPELAVNLQLKDDFKNMHSFSLSCFLHVLTRRHFLCLPLKEKLNWSSFHVIPVDFSSLQFRWSLSDRRIFCSGLPNGLWKPNLKWSSTATAC